MKKHLVTIFVSFLALCAQVTFGQHVQYKPIPEGFDFPAPQETLLKYLKDADVPAMRKHCWMVFAGLTQPARPSEPASEAVWETWYGGSSVWSKGPGPQGVERFSREFSV